MSNNNFSKHHKKNELELSDKVHIDESIRKHGPIVKLRGSTWSIDRQKISISFTAKDGKILRLQMEKREAEWLLQTLNHYFDANTYSLNEKSSGIPISEVSRPQDGRNV